MSGVSIVGALLRTHAPIVALVPLERIKAGRLPENAVLPAILLRSVSRVDQLKPLKRGAMNRSAERVSVTVRAGSYRELGVLIGLVRACCSGRSGDLGGWSGVSILPAGLGPDLDGPGNSFERTQDFRVSFEDFA